MSTNVLTGFDPSRFQRPSGHWSKPCCRALAQLRESTSSLLYLSVNAFISSDESVPTQNDGSYLSAARDVRISRSENEDAVIQFGALRYRGREPSEQIRSWFQQKCSCQYVFVFIFVFSLNKPDKQAANCLVFQRERQKLWLGCCFFWLLLLFFLIILNWSCFSSLNKNILSGPFWRCCMRFLFIFLYYTLFWFCSCFVIKSLAFTNAWSVIWADCYQTFF